jgi:hypothetical protein
VSAVDHGSLLVGTIGSNIEVFGVEVGTLSYTRKKSRGICGYKFHSFIFWKYHWIISLKFLN